MAWIAFKSYSNILVDDSNAPLYAKAVKGLETIENMRSGNELLGEIAHALHRLEIKPIAGNGGSSTGYVSSSNYTLLAQAIKSNNAVLYKTGSHRRPWKRPAALGRDQRVRGQSVCLGIDAHHLRRFEDRAAPWPPPRPPRRRRC